MITTFTAPDKTEKSVRERFAKWVSSFLIANRAIFHIDDDPADIVRGGTSDYLFSPEVADAVRETVERFRDELGNDALWDTYFPLISEKVP